MFKFKIHVCGFFFTWKQSVGVAYYNVKHIDSTFLLKCR